MTVNIKRKAVSATAAALLGFGAVAMASPAQAEPVYTKFIEANSAPSCAHMTQGKVWQLESKGYAVTVMNRCEANVQSWFNITYQSTLNYRVPGN